MRYRATYYTPLGVKFTDYDASDMEDAGRRAHGREVFGLVELMRYEGPLAVDYESDDCADEGSEQPNQAVADDLRPYVMPAGESDKAQRNRNVHLGTNPMDECPVRINVLQRVIHDVLLVLGKSDKVQLPKLAEHRNLVGGTNDVHVLDSCV